MLEKVKGRLGFGCMRLPMINNEVDKNEFNKMIDAFMEKGFNYFDTAHGYIDGKSELAIRECLSERYPRESFVLANKLTYWGFEKEEDILPLFNKQLECCGVEYFDFYLFHSMNHNGYEKHKRCNSFEIVKKLKEEGKIKHIGMSFHDTPEYLDMILTNHPCIEIVQLQINYLDYDDPTVQSKACYDVAVKHGKKIIVMEPVKGGALVNLPNRAKEELKTLGDRSEACFALSYVASFPEVVMILSGMGSLDMINENIETFKSPIEFKESDFKVFKRIREVIREENKIPCTKCNYCKDVCPCDIPISELFLVYNKFLSAKNSRNETKEALLKYKEKITSCLECGSCEKNCPQGIKIKEHINKFKKITK